MLTFPGRKLKALYEIREASQTKIAKEGVIKPGENYNKAEGPEKKALSTGVAEDAEKLSETEMRKESAED